MKKIVIFDFDGPIVQSFRACFGINKKFFYPDLTEDEYRERFMGNYFSFQDKRQPLNPDIDFFSEYRKEFHNMPIVPGIDNIIQEISDNDYELYIVSSTSGPVINEWLELHNLRSYFKEILGAEIKSKIEKIQMITAETEINDPFFITDTVGDIEEARKAGISDSKIIAIDWGYHSKELLEQTGIGVISQVGEIAQLLLKRE